MTLLTRAHQVQKPIGACDMMITYVLLMVLATHDGKPIGVETAYFQGKKSCELAAMKVQQDLGRKFDVSVVCLPQGK
jgi:inner membrane protein involved in colicin E2 resistance